MNCPRCGKPASEEDLRRFGGVCVACVLSFASEEEYPDLPGLEIASRIGRGGMGIVYKAVQRPLGRPVAVKVLSPALDGDPAFVERFTREARALAQLSHPGIVTVHDFGVARGVPYLVMELVPGASLRRLMGPGRVPAGRALEIVGQVCDALAYAHEQGVVHRDIKPENILMDSAGRVKIADFGLARLALEVDGRLTQTEAMLGTPRYMAPEQIETPSAVDGRADLYAVGAMLYEMLTGELPLGRFKPPSALAGTGHAVDELVLGLLEKRPEDRPGSAGKVLEKLSELGTKVRRRRSARRRGVLWAGLAALLAAGFAVWATTRPAPEPPVPPAPPAEPAWEELAGSASEGGVSRTLTNSGFPSVAVDGRGRIFIAWDEDLAGRPEIYLRMWNGTSWAELGGSASGGGISDNPGRSQDARIAIDPSGNPVVAWRDDTSGNWEIYLKRWNGTAWEELGGSATGGGISRTPSVSWSPSLRLDREGNPVVAWHEDIGGNLEIYLRRWDGRSWVEIGGSTTGGGISRTPGLSGWPTVALDAQGNPTVAWQDDSGGKPQLYLRRWDGTEWIELGGSAHGTGVSGNTGRFFLGGLQLGARGWPLVSWSDDRSGNMEVYLRRWDGSAWVGLGGSDSGGGVSRTPTDSIGGSLALDSEGNPVLAWQEQLPNNNEIYLRQWDGRGWSDLKGSASGGGVSRTAGNSEAPGLAVDPSGRITVTWFDRTPGNAEIYVRRWGRK